MHAFVGHYGPLIFDILIVSHNILPCNDLNLSKYGYSTVCPDLSHVVMTYLKDSKQNCLLKNLTMVSKSYRVLVCFVFIFNVNLPTLDRWLLFD
jgi:hypothetical protein